MELIKKVSKQAGWQVLGKLVSSSSTLIILGLITRNYGKDGTGLYTLGTTYLAFFYLLADLGLNGFFLPRVQKDKDEISRLFLFRLFWSILLVFVCNLALPFLPFSNNAFNELILIGSITIIFSSFFQTINLVFQQRLSYGKSVIASSLGSLIAVPVAFYLVLNHAYVYELALIFVVGWFVNSMAGLFLVNKFYKFRIITQNYSVYIKDLISAWPVSLTLLLNTVYFRIDSFILSSVRSFSEVGIYNIAYSIFQALLTVPTFIMNAFYPLMLKELDKGFVGFKRVVFRACLVMFFIGFLGAILTIMFSSTAVSILAGKEFPDSSQALKILSLSFPAFFTSAVLIWVFMALKKFKTMLVIYSSGLIANLIFNLVYIPRHSYIAASWVTVVSEYLILLLQMVILFRSMRDKI